MFSRSPRDMGARSPAILPPIRTTYDDSYHPLRPQVQEVVSTDRLENLESRLQHQEMTTKQLLERAVKIKQDIMENLNFTHGTWQEEKDSRELLQEHVKTITNVVKQLSKDIQLMSDDIKNKEAGIQGANSSLKTLETHHVAGITDLRGRVARADAAIGKLSTDLKQVNEGVREMGSMELGERQKLVDRLQHIDNKVSDVYQRIERVQGDLGMLIKSSVDETSKSLTHLDSKTRSIIEDLRHSVSNLSVTLTSELEKLETRMYAYVDKHLAARDSRLEKVELDNQDFERQVLTRLTTLEEEHQKQKSQMAKVHADLDARLQQYYDTVYRTQAAELAKIKREMREGFGTVHETVNNMKSVIEGRQKLLEESLRREIAQIRKMVVLI